MAVQDVQVLREVVRKLVPMIAGRGVRVTQMGAQAYVSHDARTGKTNRVNIPHLPDNADEALILATQGFIDHECGHILDTDWKAVAGGKDVGREIAEDQKINADVAIGRILNLANIVEDPFVERCMQKRFPGVAWNLDKLYDIFIKRKTQPALDGAKNDADRFAVLLVPIIRSIAGQKYFTDFLDAGKHWDEPLVKAFMDRVSEPLRKEIRTIKTSWDSLDIARQLYDILHPEPPPAPPPPPPAPPKDPKDDKSSGKGKSKKPGDGAGSSDKPEEEDDKGSGGEMMDEPPPPEADAEESADPEKDEGEADAPEDKKDGEGEEAPAETEPADAEDSEAEPDMDEPEPSPEDPSDSDSVDGGDGPPEEKAESEEADEGDDSEKGADEITGDEPPAEESEKTGAGEPSSDEAEESDGASEDAMGKPSEGEPEEAEPSPFMSVEVPDSDDLSAAISDMITDAATRETRGADYRIYTGEWDIIEPLDIGSDYQPGWLEALDGQTRHMVAPMQKEIERMMAARSQSVKVPGFRSGRLHGGSLHRLRVNDDRVFRRKQENHDTATAVSLVVDNSGSMGSHKTAIAMASAYALSQTLERVGIKHEVIGFTTKNLLPAQERELRAEEARIGMTFSRVERLYMPIYKGFDERLTPDVRSRFAKAFARAGFLSQNIDGESVAVATRRLMQQREPRKVMLVFSDGQPACYSHHHDEIHSSLHASVADCKRLGIEIVGIGIEDDSVRTYYPKYIVLESVEELPKTVMGELKRILIRQDK
jgi:hypothetical protein